MKKLLLILALLLTPLMASAQLMTPQGGTGTTSPSGILFGDGTLHLKTLIIGANLTLTGSTLSSTGGGGGTFPFTPTSYGNSTSSIIGFLAGLFTNGSTTVTSVGTGAVTANNGLLSGVPTTTASCSGTASCTSFTIFGASPITITGAAGTAASSTLYGDFGTWTGLNKFANITFTNATGTTLALSGSTTIQGVLNVASTINANGGVTGTLTGNASTATALAANGSNCSAGFFALGVDASGNAENCTFAFGTTTPWAPDQFVYLNHTGVAVTAASSSFFGYTPLNPTRNVNTTFPLQGGGNLTSDLTLTTAFGTTSTWGLGNNGFIITSATGIPFVAASSSLSLPSSALQNTSVTAASYTNTNLTVNAEGQITAASNGSAGSGAFPFTPVTLGNSTSTLILFTKGIIANATSTIGDGTQAGGLTISGGATTTQGLVVQGSGTPQVTIGSSSPFAQFSLHANNSNATIYTTLFAIGSSTASATTTLFTVGNTGAITQSGGATSTFSNGLNLTSGCLQYNGTCITQNAGTVTSVTATAPIFSSGGVTPNITWAGLATTSNLTQGQILYNTTAGNGVASEATGTITCTGNASCGAGSYVLGSNLTITATGGTGSGLATTAPVSAGNLLYYNSSGAGSATGVATTTLSFSSFPANLSAAIGALVGGNNATWTWWGLATTSALTQGQLLYNTTGGNGVASVATGTVSAGSTAITVTAGRSVIGGALSIDCAGASASQNGCLSSGDWTTFNGKDSFAWPFSALTNFGVTTSATTTPLWAETPTSGTISLAASSTSEFDRMLIGTSSPQTQIWGAAATSSFASGINLSNGGCFAYAGVCLTAGIISGGATQAVNYATTGGLPAYAYLNGTGGVGATITEVSNAALSVDGANPSVGQRVLVKNESGSCTSSSGTCINGIYIVTAAGSGIAVFVLTRALDYDQSIDVTPGISTYVLSGTTNGDTTWALTAAAPITIGVTGLTYSQLANGNITIPVSVANGGTGQQTFTSSQLLYGNGTNALSSVATSTATCSSGISCSAFTVVGSVNPSFTNSGVTSNVAGNGITLSGGTGAVTINQTSYVATSTGETDGNLAYWTSTNGTPATLGKVATTTLSFNSFPANLVGPLGALVGGSNSTLTWWGLATTSALTQGQLLYNTTGGNGVASVATTSVTCNNGLSCLFNAVGTVTTVPGLATINAGVLGAVLNGNIPTSQATSTLYGTAPAGGYVLGWDNNKSGIGWIATSSAVGGGVTSVSATAPVFSSGGATPNITWYGLATTSQPASSNLLVSNGVAGVYGVATTSASCSGGITCNAFAVLGSTNPSFKVFNFPWTAQTYGNSTSTTLGFLNGFMSNAASSTITGGLTFNAGGTLDIPQYTASTTLNTTGQLAVNTTTASSSVMFDNGSVFELYPDSDRVFSFASSTLQYEGKFAAAASTTILLGNYNRVVTLVNFYCKTDVGSLLVRFGNGTTASTTSLYCDKSGEELDNPTNARFTRRSNFDIELGSATTTPNVITITADIRQEAE